jgi:hypothetical protein
VFAEPFDLLRRPRGHLAVLDGVTGDDNDLSAFNGERRLEC